MKFSEVAKEVISLAETIRRYWNTELPKRHPDYPFINEGEDSGPPPPEEKELSDLLEQLPEQDIYKLMTIMSLGRGYFGPNDTSLGYDQVKSTYESPAIAAAIMMGKASLAPYLSDGLAKLRQSGIDVDDWMCHPVGSNR